jgi:hypothetical protein
VAVVQAQAPASEAGGAKPAAAAPAARYRTHGNLNQVMRGILFPNSNVVFAAQSEEFASIKQDKDPSLATDPLRGVYNSWTAVEDSGYALAEAANLLMIPGRVCSNGKPAPVGNADWAKFAAGLRDAGMEAVKAAEGQEPGRDARRERQDDVGLLGLPRRLSREDRQAGRRGRALHEDRRWGRWGWRAGVEGSYRLTAEPPYPPVSVSRPSSRPPGCTSNRRPRAIDRHRAN